MIFYLYIKPDKQLTHIPHIDSIYLNINKKSVCCTWDETDALIEDGDIYYRFKGIYFDDKYANKFLNNISSESIKIEEINWEEDDNPEEFECKEIFLNIDDNGYTIKVYN